MVAEAEIVVLLTVREGVVTEGEVTRSEVSLPAFAGRSPSEAARLVPMLFSVCRMAHAVAFSRALEAALLTPESDPAVEAAREALCFAEAAVSHVWQFALAWPEASGTASDAVAVRRARRALAELSEALFPKPPVMSFHTRPDWELAHALLETLEQLVHSFADAESPFESAVKEAGLAELGQCSTRLARLPRRAESFPESVVKDFASRPRTFVASPEMFGEPVDVSAFARWTPPRERGDTGGLSARLLAKRAVAVSDIDMAKTWLQVASRRGSPPPDVSWGEPALSRGEGVGTAPTARGPLLHWVRGNAERLDDFVSLSPTDWTFHPRGVLGSALVGLSAASAVRDASWFTLALDPCVPFRVELLHA